MSTALISILCEDHPGLIADVTGRLFDIGVNLGDTTFAILGGGAEFTLVAKLPDDVAPVDVERELKSLPGMDEARLSVTPFRYRETHDDAARITHRIEIAGDDSPGLVARLSEAFRGYGANIVRLNSESTPAVGAASFILRVAAYIPADKAEACLATVANTAGQLNLKCRSQAAE